jgi:beta-lactamase regulating signal transducer with metallopeptidase domain
MLDATMLVEWATKSVVLAGAMLGVLRLMNSQSAAQRSLVGHLGLVALVALPAASLLIPAWNPLPVTADTTARALDLAAFAHLSHPAPVAIAAASSVSADSAAATWQMPSAGELAVGLYLIPLAILLLTMVVAVVRLGAMHRRANVLVNPSWQAALAMAQRRMGFKHGTALLVSEELRSPVSWGVMRPIILLNEQAVSAVGEAEAIIAHELAHVARLDWAKLLIARLACALFWFNPLVWRLARECHQLREEAADDAVLLSEVDGADYASLLVNAARHDNRALLLAAHGVAPGKDSLKRRITRVLDADLARGPANNGWVALCLVALVAVAAPLAAFDPTARVAGDSPGIVGHSSIVLTARGGDRTLTINHFPNGHEALSAGALAAADRDKSANQADLRDRDRDRAHDDEVDAIIASKAVGLTPEYVAAMRAAGFDGSVDDLTGARAVGVTPEFAQQMRQYDPKVDLDTVIGAKATGLSPAYFSEMRRMYPNLTLDDAVGMSAVGVTISFAQQMRELFPHVTADQLQGMAAVGVTPGYVRESRRQGVPAGSPDQAIQNRVLFTGARGAPNVRVAPQMPAAAHAALAASISSSVAHSVSMANGIARSVAVSVSPVPPAPPGRPDDN